MPTKFTFILLASSITCMLQGQSPQAVNSFGEVLYQHPGSVLSSGFVTQNSPGFLMAGHLPVAAQGVNFYIDRTAEGGDIINNPNGFQRAYSISTSTNCKSPYAPAPGCSGISVIETNVASGPVQPALSYALAGAVDEGVFISFLDATGVPVNTHYINFAIVENNPIHSVKKPLILEASTSLSGSREYYVCGTYNFILPYSGNLISVFYAYRINTQGVIVWNHQYLCIHDGYLEVRDMIESPYNNNLVLVGKSLNSGVLIDLDRPTGGSVYRNVVFYNVKNNPSSFSCITPSEVQPVTGGGYVIGGENQPLVGNGYAWVLKVNPFGNVTWSTVLIPSSDRKPLNITDIIERKVFTPTSTPSLNYEYYAVTSSRMSGAMVLKLNNLGLPFPSGSNEFVFNTGNPNNPSTGNFISHSQNRAFDNGLHVFGNNTASGPNEHYLIQSYFNGFAGCNNPLRFTRHDRPEVILKSSGVMDMNLPIDQCSGFVITSTLVNAYNAVCGPNTSLLPPASNAKGAATGIGDEENYASTKFSISPNPTANRTMITFETSSSSAFQLSLYNALGQLAKTLEVSEQSTTLELDFESMGLEAGVYFIKSSNGNTAHQKIIYTKS